mmetsp:Transcript_3441/g.8101  ORF Transcript_3441/g.8101 Transcript_3441/m.8101 type:complete len:285 (-) Transcript_3441:316-1170(-)
MANPFQRFCPRVISHPVANEVIFADVNESAFSSFENFSNILSKAQHPISAIYKLHVHKSIAARPRLLHPQSLFNIRLVQILSDRTKIVTKRRMFALFADIVQVDPSGLDWYELSKRAEDIRVETSRPLDRAIRDITTRVECVASKRQGLTNRQHACHNGCLSFVHQVVCLCVGEVVGKLHSGRCQTISNGDRFKINFPFSGLVVLDDFGSDGRNVVTRVGLAHYMKVEILVLWMLLQKARDKIPHVIRYSLFAKVGRSVGKSGPGRLVDPQNGGVGVPAELVQR